MADEEEEAGGVGVDDDTSFASPRKSSFDAPERSNPVMLFDAGGISARGIWLNMSSIAQE